VNSMYRRWECHWSRSESVAAVSTELRLVSIACTSQKIAVQWSATHLSIWLYNIQLLLFPYVKMPSKGDDFRVSKIKKNVTTKLNAVPQHAFNDSFVQLFQRCKNSGAVKRVYFKGNTTIFSFFMHICSYTWSPGITLFQQCHYI